MTILAQTIIYNGRVILLPYYSFSQPSIHQTVGSLPVIQHEVFHTFNRHSLRMTPITCTRTIMLRNSAISSSPSASPIGTPSCMVPLPPLCPSYRGVLVPSVRNDCYKFFLQIDVMDKSYDVCPPLLPSHSRPKPSI